MSTTEKHISPILKLVLEIGPLAAFFLTFRYGEELLANPGLFALLETATGPEILRSETGPLMVATACFMVAIALSLGTSWALTRSLPKMAVVTAVVVAVMGGLTLVLADDTFIKMKPTIVNGLFALALIFGLLRGRSYLKYLMGDAMPLDDAGWMIFTRRWVWFFLALAVLNELVWRTQSDDVWVNVKTFVNPVLTFIFIAFQWPLLQRHSVEESR